MVQAAEVLVFEARLKDFMTKELKRLGMTTKQETTKARESFQRLDKTLGTARKSVAMLGLALKAAFVAAAFVGVRNGIRTMREFGKGMAEVRTILDETTLSFDFAKQKVIDLTYETGAAGKEIAKGLYQTLSAGITDGADAMTVLTGASKLSVGALMSVNESVDLVTNAFNAYGMTVSEEAVTATTDLMFKTIELGKTTGPELAHSLGMVMPVASNLGVSLEELNAMLAALTLGGMDTAMASTQLRQAMVQLLNPSDDAKALMREYNVEISAARVSQEGFLPVLADIKNRFGDNAIAMRTLFPNIRALVGVMALAGNQFDSVNRIMGEFSNASGSVEQAVDKMQNTLDFKMKLISTAWSGFFVGLVKEMQGAVEQMTVDELQDFAKSTKEIGESFGEMLAPVVNIIPVAMGSMLVGAKKVYVEIIELSIAAAELERKLLGAAQAFLMFMGDAAPAQAVLALNDAIKNNATAQAVFNKSLRDAEDSLQRSVVASTRLTIQYADLHGFGHLFSEEMRAANRMVDEMIEKHDRLAQEAKDRAEAERVANQRGERRNSLMLDYLIFADEVTKAMSRDQAEARARSFEREIGYLMTVSEVANETAQATLDHDRAMHRDRMRIRADDLDAFRALKEEEMRIELEARKLKLDSAFLEMKASEDFMILNEKGQQEMIRLFKERYDAQLELAALAAQSEMDDEIAQEARVRRMERLQAKEEELAIAREVLAEKWDQFGMTFDNVTASAVQGLKEWAAQVGDMNMNVQRLTVELVDGLIGAFLDGIEMAIEGTRSWEEAFRDFSKNFLRMMAEMIMQQIVLNTLRSMFPTMNFAYGGVVPGGTGEMVPLADGGVVDGGLGRAMPVRGYATGGPIVSGPHVALIGEGQHNEAVVPLPDGRSIPVDLQGGSGEASVNISISTVDAAGVDELLINRQSTLRNIIRQAMDEDRAFRTAVRMR